MLFFSTVQDDSNKKKMDGCFFGWMDGQTDLGSCVNPLTLCVFYFQIPSQTKKQLNPLMTRCRCTYSEGLCSLWGHGFPAGGPGHGFPAGGARAAVRTHNMKQSHKTFLKLMGIKLTPNDCWCQFRSEMTWIFLSVVCWALRFCPAVLSVCAHFLTAFVISFWLQPQVERDHSTDC